MCRRDSLPSSVDLQRKRTKLFFIVMRARGECATGHVILVLLIIMRRSRRPRANLAYPVYTYIHQCYALRAGL